jgi:hypothetical protein
VATGVFWLDLPENETEINSKQFFSPEKETKETGK